jgi:hypothetical protein
VPNLATTYGSTLHDGNLGDVCMFLSQGVWRLPKEGELGLPIATGRLWNVDKWSRGTAGWALSNPYGNQSGTFNIIDNNGGYIYDSSNMKLPATGTEIGSQTANNSSWGYYWSGDSYNSNGAWNLQFSTAICAKTYHETDMAFPIRCVLK